MSGHSEHKLDRKQETLAVSKIASTLSYIGAALVAVSAFASLVGWIADVRWLKTLIPGQSAIPSNASITWMLAAISLILISDQRRVLRIPGQVVASVVLLVGLVTLSECAFKIDLPFELSLQPQGDSLPIVFPGSLFYQESVPFVGLGLALLLYSARGISRLISAILTVVAVAPSVQGIVGYIFNNQDLYRFCTAYECASLHIVCSLWSIIFCLSLLIGIIGKNAIAAPCSN